MLDGYRGSRPVRVGNACRRADAAGHLRRPAQDRAASTRRPAGDWIARPAGDSQRSPTSSAASGAEPDSGIWEVRSEADALHPLEDDVLGGAGLRAPPGGRRPHRSRHAPAWLAERLAIREFIEERCWSPRLRSYTRHAGGDDVDASLLLGVLLGYEGPPDRLAATVDAVQRELGHGPLLARYSGDDGLRGAEGAFLCCSFWLADALARIGRVDEATALMEQLIALANDVGIYCEELDPSHRRPAGQHAPGTRAPRAHQCGRLDREGERMSIWGALAGGFVGTLVLTTGLRTANELGLTRVDLPFLLGTAVTRDRARAKAIGYLMHLAAGEVFALVYFAIFTAIGTSGLAPRRALRTAARNRLRDRAREHPAAGRSSPHGQPVERRRQQPTAGASGIPHAQLRQPHTDRHPAHPRRLRRNRRRVRVDRPAEDVSSTLHSHSKWSSPVAASRRSSSCSLSTTSRPTVSRSRSWRRRSTSSRDGPLPGQRGEARRRRMRTWETVPSLYARMRALLVSTAGGEDRSSSYRRASARAPMPGTAPPEAGKRIRVHPSRNTPSSASLGMRCFPSKGTRVGGQTSVA